MQSTTTHSWPFTVFVLVSVALSAYFGYSAVRGDLGVLGRLVVTSEIEQLSRQKAATEQAIEELANKTRRLSDGYLDLDLLDERARRVLGMMRADELVLHETTITVQ